MLSRVYDCHEEWFLKKWSWNSTNKLIYLDTDVPRCSERLLFVKAIGVSQIVRETLNGLPIDGLFDYRLPGFTASTFGSVAMIHATTLDADSAAFCFACTELLGGHQ